RNRILGGSEFGVSVIRQAEATRIRQTDIEGVDGPSFTHFFLFGAADPPSLATAAATSGSASLTLTPRSTGPLDVFVSEDCASGNADGTYIATVNGVEGAEQVVRLSYADLPGQGNSGAIGSWFAATSTPTAADGTTSLFSDCVRIADPADLAQADVAEGETGEVLDDVGVEVEITENGVEPDAPARRASGTLYAARYGAGVFPEPSPIEGSATTPSGATLAPNAVALNRHWTLRTDDLDGVTYAVCLDIDGVPGVVEPSQLVVASRPDASAPWVPSASTLEGGRLCAEGLTAWGDFGIGADSAVNPVPGETGDPVAVLPAVVALSVYPNPTAMGATVEIALPEAAEVRAEVFDLLGRRVAVLHDGMLAAGAQALRLDGAALPGGVYVVRAATPEATLTQRLTLVR
ncbi:MAG: T9SS type A sorting domain-containing protein, partial [Bacteroidota bacterium]